MINHDVNLIAVGDVHFSPSAVEEAVKGVIGYGGEYRIVISRAEAEPIDDLLIQIEHDARTQAQGHPSIDAFRRRVENALRPMLGTSVHVLGMTPGSLKRISSPAERVIDNRNLWRETFNR